MPAAAPSPPVGVDQEDAAGSGPAEQRELLDGADDDDDCCDDDDDCSDSNGLSGLVALKFLGAGGIAGAGARAPLAASPLAASPGARGRAAEPRADACPSIARSPLPPVSRTATAPFDRVKVFLITDSGHLHPPRDGGSTVAKAAPGLAKMRAAILRLYSGGGGLRAFWVGNGLNVLKIMPESAIKFFSYESSVRALLPKQLLLRQSKRLTRSSAGWLLAETRARSVLGPRRRPDAHLGLVALPRRRPRRHHQPVCHLPSAFLPALLAVPGRL